MSMTCDYAVWFPHVRRSDAEAAVLYAGLCAGTAPPPTAHPAIDVFYADITARHPAFDEVPKEQTDDKDFCPWSAPFQRSPGHMILSCVTPMDDHVGQLVHSLARQHGLAVYDPQRKRITYPPDPHRSRPWWKIW